MKRTIDGPELVTALKYAIENEMIENETHSKIALSMNDFYNKSSFLTGKQVEFLSRILEPVNIPEGLELLPFRQPVVTKDGPPERSTNRAGMDGKGHINITFKYDPELIALVKTLSGRRYQKASRSWKAPLQYVTIEKLLEWKFKLSPDLKKWYTNQVAPEDVNITEIPGLQIPLMDFQTEGVNFIEKHNGNALLADEMGLGKSAQALAYLQLHPELRPAIIVCPASLKYNWQNEINKFMDGKDSVQIISGRDTDQDLHGSIIIINYDILPDLTEKDLFHEDKRVTVPGTGWWGRLVKYGAKVVIYDEVHFCKSNKANRTKACQKMAKAMPHVIGLSGTPILNRPCEIHAPVNMINPYVFPAFMKFALEFCSAYKGKFGWDFGGASNTQRLHKILCETVMIRHLKKDVLQQLPDKVYSVVPLVIENMPEYKKAEDDFIYYLQSFDSERAERAKRAEQLARIEGLKQLAVKGKMAQCKKWITNFLDSGEKLVVFANHRSVISEIQDAFPDISVKLDGGTLGTHRQKVVDSFQTDPKIKLFLGNVKAAGVGISLVASSNVLMLENPWTPGEVSQAVDRCHRIGQEDSVNCYFLIAKDTVEEQILTLLQEKAAVLDKVVDGLEVNQDKASTGSVFTALVENMSK